jgi:hypothetical protein
LVPLTRRVAAPSPVGRGICLRHFPYFATFIAAKTHDASLARDQIRNTETMRNVGMPRSSGLIVCRSSLFLVLIDNRVMAASLDHFVFEYVQRVDVVL